MRHWVLIAAVVGMVLLAAVGGFVARAADPIKIGFGMALTGGLSANGKPALLAMQIWKDDVNKKGGLLGRPVELVYYDDQTNPATVPGIYSKLLDVDKVRQLARTVTDATSALERRHARPAPSAPETLRDRRGAVPEGARPARAQDGRHGGWGRDRDAEARGTPAPDGDADDQGDAEEADPPGAG